MWEHEDDLDVGPGVGSESIGRSVKAGRRVSGGVVGMWWCEGGFSGYIQIRALTGFFFFSPIVTVSFWGPAVPAVRARARGSVADGYAQLTANLGPHGSLCMRWSAFPPSTVCGR